MTGHRLLVAARIRLARFCHGGTVNRPRGGATAAEIAAAGVSVVLVAVATFVRSAQMVAPTGAVILRV